MNVDLLHKVCIHIYIYMCVQHVNTYVYMFIYMVLLYYVCIHSNTRQQKMETGSKTSFFSESGIFAYHLCAKKI